MADKAATTSTLPLHNNNGRKLEVHHHQKGLLLFCVCYESLFVGAAGDAHLSGPPPLVVGEEATMLNRDTFIDVIAGEPGRAAAAVQLTSAQQIETSKVDELIIIAAAAVALLIIIYPHHLFEHVLTGKWVALEQLVRHGGSGSLLSGRLGHRLGELQWAHAQFPAPFIEDGQCGLDKAVRTEVGAQLDAGHFLKKQKNISILQTKNVQMKIYLRIAKVQRQPEDVTLLVGHVGPGAATDAKFFCLRPLGGDVPTPSASLAHVPGPAAQF